MLVISYQILRDCRDLKEEVEQYEDRLRSMDPAGQTGQRVDGMPRSTKISRPTEDAAIVYMEVVEMMEALISRRRAMIAEILKACMELKSLQRRIIICRYVEAKSWKEIVYELQYSKTWIWEQHNAAIKSLTGEDADTSDQIW